MTYGRATDLNDGSTYLEKRTCAAGARPIGAPELFVSSLDGLQRRTSAHQDDQSLPLQQHQRRACGWLRSTDRLSTLS